MTPGCQYNDQKDDQKGRLMSKELVITEPEELMKGLYTSLRDRGISLETCEAYGYQTYITSSGVELHIADHRHIDTHEVVAQQLRYPDKSFPWINGKQPIELFGLHLCKDVNKPVYITEGQIDAMSIYEASNGQVQACSISKGIGNAKTELVQNMQRLKQFKQIVLFFDNDEPGKRGLEECKSLLPVGKGSYIELGRTVLAKDANDLLKSVPTELIPIMEYYTKEIVPEGLISSLDVDYQDLLVPVPIGHNLPQETLNDWLRGIQESRLYMLGAGTGCGKTEILKWICCNWIFKKQGVKVAHIFLEESQKQTLQSYIAFYARVPNYKFAENPKIVQDQTFIDACTIFKNSQSILLNHFGSLQSQRLFDVLEYCASKVDVIVLDHISIAISGNISSREGERKDIDLLMTKLKTLTTQTKVSIITVSHLTRPQGIEGFEDGKKVTLNSFRGSGSLTQLSDVVIGLNRNTQHATDKNKLGITILKNRITGRLGYVGDVYYLEDIGQLVTPEDLIGNKNNANFN